MKITKPIRNAIIYCLFFAFIAGFFAKDYFKNLEIKAFDTHMRNSEILTHPDIVLISIDDESIDKIDSWPFTRDLIARVIDYVNSADPSLIVFTDTMAQEQKDMGAEYLTILQEKVKTLPQGPELDTLQLQIQNAIEVISTDNKLSQSIQQTNSYLAPIALIPTTQAFDPNIEPDEHQELFSFNDERKNQFSPQEAVYKIRKPNSIIFPAIDYFGHINKSLDDDEILRQETHLWSANHRLFPSLALQIYLHEKNKKSLDQNIDKKIMHSNEQLSINNFVLDLPSNGRLHTRFYSGKRQELFKQYSFYNVFTEAVPVQEFKNKVVLIGVTAAGNGSRYKVSSGQNLSAVEILAHTSSSLLNDDWVKRSNSQRIVEGFIYFLIAGYLIFLLPKIEILNNLAIVAAISLSLMVFEFGSLEFSYWYKFVTPLIFLILGLTSLSLINLRTREFSQAKLTREKDETNLQLGLAFQNQGALDLAFEKYLNCTPNSNLNSPLYNLGLEYERKRQFAKAGAVYECLAKISPEHLDVQNRVHKCKNLAANSTQQMFSNESKLASLLQNGNELENPRLGRYEIVREIGRGAMSIVYAGIDPSINRTVAIKVQSFIGDDEAQIKKMRARFLTEAKTAGQLNHPNIITIYDIGEESDLIYIAMEYLHGQSLEFHLKDKTLSDLTIIDICIRIAEALDYAHEHKVIHRDIKPSNIIYQKESNKIHLTDFGIARMQDAHLTQTGQVVGTPSYMSPEQITGKRVDRRSDLFSLGVTMYQLFTEQLPFQADTLATLLYKITMEAPIPFDSMRPDLPPLLNNIINKLLKKDAVDRYESAEALAKDLEDCKNSIKNTL